MASPVPKRDAERRRRNVKAVPTTSVDIEAIEDDDPLSLGWLIKQPIIIPDVPMTRPPKAATDDEIQAHVSAPEWHPIALELWESFSKSGQAIFWEPSDWMVAKLICESISRDLKPQFVGVTPGTPEMPGEAIYEKIPFKGASLGAYLKAFTALMLTEGDRRRLSIELERERTRAGLDGPKADVIPMKDRRAAKLAAAAHQASA